MWKYCCRSANPYVCLVPPRMTEPTSIRGVSWIKLVGPELLDEEVLSGTVSPILSRASRRARISRQSGDSGTSDVPGGGGSSELDGWQQCEASSGQPSLVVVITARSARPTGQ